MSTRPSVKESKDSKDKDAGMLSLVRHGPQGNLDVIVHEAKELRDTEMVGKNDNYAKLTLAKQTHRTKTHDNGGSIAQWEDAFSFSLKGLDNEVVMIVDVWNQNVTKDAHIGSCVIPVIEMIKNQAKKQWYQISAQGKVAGQVCMSISFLPAVIIQVLECKELHKVQLLGKQDPYVRICLGLKQKYSSKVAVDGHVTPKWHDQRMTFNKPVEKKKEEEVVENDPSFLIKVRNKNNVTKDELIGSTSITWSAVQKAKDQGPMWLPLTRTSKLEGQKSSGQICISVQEFKVAFPKEHQQLLSRSTTFIPAGRGPQGNMYLTVHEARGLRNTEVIGNQDPYVQIAVGPTQERRTKANDNSGSVGKWEERMLFSLQGQEEESETKMSVINANVLVDTLIGTCTIATLELLMDLPKKKWYQLIAEGKIAGELCISVEFASALTLHVVECKELYNTQFLGSQDPYVTIRCGKQKGQTKTCTDGGRAPKWGTDDKLTFNKPVDKAKEKTVKKTKTETKDAQAQAQGSTPAPTPEVKKPLPDPTEDPQFHIQVWNDNYVSDALIGECRVMWSELASKTSQGQPVWLNLTRGSAAKGTEKPAGQICLLPSVHQFKMPDRSQLALKKEAEPKKEDAKKEDPKKAEPKKEDAKKEEPKKDGQMVGVGVSAMRTQSFITTDAFGNQVMITQTVQPVMPGMIMTNGGMMMTGQPMMMQGGMNMNMMMAGQQQQQQQVAPKKEEAKKEEAKKEEKKEEKKDDQFVLSSHAPVKGNLTITLHEAKDLKDTATVGAQDPFVKLALTKHKDQRTKTHVKGGTKAHWDENLSLGVGDPEQTTIIMTVINENLFKNAEIGQATLNVFDLCKKQPKKQWIPISNKGEAAGQVLISSTFTPGVVIEVLDCKDLFKTQTIGRMDPYVKIKVGITYPKQKGRTAVCANGNTTPVFKHEKHIFYRPVESDKKTKESIEDPVFEIKVMNKSITRDSVIGTTWVKWSELQKIKGGKDATYFNLVRGDPKRDAGRIALKTSDWQFEQTPASPSNKP